MSEQIILSGSEETLKPIITLLLGIHQLIENRDIGDFVGLPLPQALQAQPHTVKLTIWFYSNKEPPFKGKPGEPFVRACYNIPDVDRRKLSWEAIKLAAGGANGYTWGRFRASANLSNGRQMQVYGGDEEQAKERMFALASLSKAKIQTLTVAEEKKYGRRATNRLMYKETTKIYPGYFSVINTEKLLVEAEREQFQAKSTKNKPTGQLSGDFIRKKTKKIPLWVTKEPSNCKSLIKEALRVRGANSKD